MTKITIPETPTVEQAAKALIDAVSACEEVRAIVIRHGGHFTFIATLRALAGDA